jgi:hypothetical protein
MVRSFGEVVSIAAEDRVVVYGENYEFHEKTDGGTH